MVMKWPPVYTASFGRYVKIGLTERDPDDRRRDLQTGNPFKLIVKAWYEVKKMKLAEEDAQYVARKYQTFGGGKEWFHVPKGVDLNKFITTIYDTLDKNNRLRS